MSLNAINMNMEAKPPKEALVDKDMDTLDQVDMKDMGKIYCRMRIIVRVLGLISFSFRYVYYFVLFR